MTIAGPKVEATPILLCGGSGTRLWPLSRKSYPKQFVPLVGEETLFQASAQRLAGAGFAAPVIITGSDFRFIVTEQLAAIGVDPAAILIEPSARNTAPAVLAAALYVAQGNPDAVLLIAPSDHVIRDVAGFGAAVQAGMAAVAQGRMVTFGITPTHPETAYGYLELSSAPKAGQATPLTRFVEKPDAARAGQMIAARNYLWNAGIFLCRASDVIAAFHAHAGDLVAPVTQAIAAGKGDLGFFRLDPAAWERLPDISIDYAVMERADNLSVVPFDGGWSDLGGWDAVWREGARDGRGVGTSGAVTAIDCDDALLRSESDAVELVGIGLRDVMVVATGDAVLVAGMDRAQDVKLAVSALKRKGAKQAESFPRDHRPWGWFESLAMGDRFQVKRIHVHPKAALSLQSHHHRAEHWIVVQGTAEVTVGDRVQLVTENQSVYIPLGEKHRLANPGKLPLVLIEVQTGSYLGEDDIIRYEDVYARGQGAKG